MTSLVQLNSQSWVNCTHLQGFSESTTFWSAEKPRYYYMTHHMISSICADHPSSINLVVLIVLGWPFYNSKSSKPNEWSKLFWKRNKKTFSYFWVFIRATHSAITIAGLWAQQSPCRNLPPTSEDKLAQTARRAPTNDSGTFSQTPAMSRVLIPVLAPLFAFAKLVTKYTNADVQKATKLTLESFVQGQQYA